MSTYARCRKCDYFSAVLTHQCPPKWRVHHEDSHGDRDDDHAVFYGNNARDAAKKWAVEYDADNEFPILAGDTVFVDVRLDSDENAPWIECSVTGESVPRYYVQEDD